MRLLMIQAEVHLSPASRAPLAVGLPSTSGAVRRGGALGPPPAAVRSRGAARRPSPGAPARSCARRVSSVIDTWRYDGRWWEERELKRDYYLLELVDGAQLELFEEEGEWWVVRVSD